MTMTLEASLQISSVVSRGGYRLVSPLKIFYKPQQLHHFCNIKKKTGATEKEKDWRRYCSIKVEQPKGSIVADLKTPSGNLSNLALSHEKELARNNGGGVTLEALQAVSREFEALPDYRSKTRLLLEYALKLGKMSEDLRVRENRVMGCTAQVWVTAEIDQSGLMQFSVDSDSEISKGIGAILVKILSDKIPEEVLSFDSSVFRSLQQLLGSSLQHPSRSNSLYSVLQAMQKKTRLLTQPSSMDRFPSLLVTTDGALEAQGDFAIAQAKYLKPDQKAVDKLGALLKAKKIGVVAHFYMDPEVQGVLVAVRQQWSHINVSDSLVMADRALAMASAGCQRIVVLGVDFMAENVRAILDRAGFAHIPVLRMASENIGCSLAEAAQSDTYLEFLGEASQTPRSVHVIYINTSLETKAKAHGMLPTITCTSSNVVQTVLQAFTQVPDLTVWYGPDTYMGGNLAEMLRQLAELSDEDISAVHKAHDRTSIRELLPRLRYYQDGACIVHDLFNQEVVDRVRSCYGDAYQTAHFEVPGEMFALAMEARSRGMGIVGSTQNILDFILERTQEGIQRGFDDRLQFVLGTEAGMITAIVQQVKGQLADAHAEGLTANLEVEIVFPVSGSAISTTDNNSSLGNREKFLGELAELAIVPGVSSGEGCSASGGCASCPYMKMNSLDALLHVCELVGTPGESLLAGYEARAFAEGEVAGRPVADIGCEPILHMRHFQKTSLLSQELVEDIMTRNSVLIS